MQESVIEVLRNYAWADPTYPEDLCGACGGNIDDAYSIGWGDGQAALAREILDTLQISYKKQEDK